MPKVELIARLSRGLRPKFDALQRRDLALVHINNLDLIATGHANSGVLFDWAESTITWSRVAELLGAGLEEMNEQLLLAERLIQRYRVWGRIAFTGPDYQLAKRGVDVMDQLADMVDRPTALAAAEWSRQKLEQIRAEDDRQKRDSAIAA